MPLITISDSYHGHHKDFLDKSHIIAVVGASNDKHKRGFHIFNRLLTNGFNVIPVYADEIPLDRKNIIGVPCYPNLSTVRPIPNVVIIVDTLIDDTLKFLREMRDNGIFKVWLDKDTFNDECIAFCKEFRFDYNYQTDILKFLEEL